MLAEKIRRHGVNTWLINTGWTGGGYGTGKRISLNYTRSMIRTVLNGDLEEVAYRNNNIFNLAIPVACPGVPEHLLDPAATWPDRDRYDLEAEKLFTQFETHYRKLEEKRPVHARNVFRLELAAL
jgi:phosphoenolpyruvate carboxykinase (ATP)